MAGIGFELRRLAQRDDLIGMAQAYAHSALATSGPWLFTIIALASIVLTGNLSATPEDLGNFRLIVVYNFAFSLVMTGPIAIIVTRYIADCIHNKSVKEIAAVLIGGLGLVYAIEAFFALPFYIGYVQLDPVVKVLAILNFFVIAGIWIVAVFLTALKNYNAVSFSFACGMLVALASAGMLAPRWALAGMLAGFDIGLALILFSLIARVFAEYPRDGRKAFEFMPYFRKYWDLALGALFYNLGIWVDKWVMWLSPDGEFLRSGLVSCPDYESAMFLSYLSIVPSMAAFTVTIETEFFEKYLVFYRDIQRHATLKTIRVNQKALIASLVAGSRNFLMLQGSICLTAILISPRILELLGVNFSQLGVFRLGLLGALFHAALLFVSIVLSYFDLRRTMLKISVLFFVSNFLFSCVSMKLGFPFYGYGYFLACFVTFAAAFLMMAYHVDRLAYQTFVRSNTSVA
jgi:uncharacterized membrane protein